ncbi:MAG: dUTP diphosphatase [Desulfohalobiaceae bacterium]|nr:dUTP diphosphatase [Desulfohalobiaceae bacterium]
MDDLKVKVKFLHPIWKDSALGYATPFSAGADLRACLHKEREWIAPGERFAVGTGLAIEIVTPGMAGFVFSRSGLGTKQGLVVSQGVGVIDPDYRGEIVVSLLNTSRSPREIVHGQRIAQLIFIPARQAQFIEVGALEPSDRGTGGFGHTGET